MECDYLLEKITGPTGYLKDQPAILQRDMVIVDKSNDKSTLKVLQWNILAQAFAIADDHLSFVKCPREAKQWETRRFRILEELIKHNVDVICLQEVDNYDGFIKPCLGAVGYEGVFEAKPDSPCLYVKGAFSPDGCCIAYRESRLTLVKSDKLVLHAAGKSTNQVALYAVFRRIGEGLAMKEKGEFCIVCTHLKASKGFEEIRTEQCKYLLREVKSRFGSSMPLIICGDFNATPEEEAYKALVNSELRLSSAYTKLPPHKDKEPDYTTWKVSPNGEEKKTVDYIFFSNDKFMVKSLLSLPTPKEIGNMGIPSDRYPSDHFALVAQLAFKR